MYTEEIDRWVENDVVDIKYTLSAKRESSEGCRHISDQMRYNAVLLH